MPRMHRRKAASPLEWEDRIPRRSALRVGTERLTQRARGRAGLVWLWNPRLRTASASLWSEDRWRFQCLNPALQSLYPQMAE